MSWRVSEKQTWGEVEREVVSGSKEKISRTEGEAGPFFFDDLPSTARFTFSGLRIHDPNVTVPCPGSINKQEKRVCLLHCFVGFLSLSIYGNRGREGRGRELVLRKNPDIKGQYLESSNVQTMTAWCTRVFLILFLSLCVYVWSLPQGSGKSKGWWRLKSQRFGVLVDILVCQWIFCLNSARKYLFFQCQIGIIIF